MTTRITDANIDGKIRTVNTLLGNDPDAPYSTIGLVVRSSAYGGTGVHRYANEFGGVSDLMGGHFPKREAARFLDGMIAALYAVRENAREDQRVVDVIAAGLGTVTEWDGAAELEWIADAIGSVRPHPGDTTPERYFIDFHDATGRNVDDLVDASKATCTYCQHQIVSLDEGESWFAPDAGTDDENGDGMWRESCPDNHTERAAPHEPQED